MGSEGIDATALLLHVLSRTLGERTDCPREKSCRSRGGQLPGEPPWGIYFRLMLDPAMRNIGDDVAQSRTLLVRHQFKCVKGSTCVTERLMLIQNTRRGVSPTDTSTLLNTALQEKGRCNFRPRRAWRAEERWRGRWYDGKPGAFGSRVITCSR